MAWRRIDVHRAVERGDLAVVKRYLDAGGDPEQKDEEYGAAPVHWAALRGRSDALSLLLERGGDVESRTSTDGTPLVWGCMGGNAPVVRLLLERGANISAKTRGKGTALHHATHSGHPEVVALLLQNGANPKAEDNRGDRPGDKFDPEVTDSNRRAIKKALARVTHGSSSRSGRASSSRSRRHADKARGGQPSLSASLARSKPRAVATDNASGGAATARANGTPPHKGENGHRHHQENSRTPPPRRDSPAKPSTEEEEEGAVVVDAAALRTPTKRPRSTDTGTAAAGGGTGWRSSNGGGWGGVVGFLAAAVDRSGGGDSRSRAHPAKGKNRDGSNTVLETVAAAAAATPAVEGGNDGPRVSPSSPAAFVVSPEKPLPSELDDLRRRVKDLTLSAATAETGDVEGRAALRRALEEADARARDAVVAERAKSESLGALVQALEQRLRERDEQVQRLTAQVKDRDSRLRQREQEEWTLIALLRQLEAQAMKSAFLHNANRGRLRFTVEVASDAISADRRTDVPDVGKGDWTAGNIRFSRFRRHPVCRSQLCSNHIYLVGDLAVSRTTAAQRVTFRQGGRPSGACGRTPHSRQDSRRTARTRISGSNARLRSDPPGG
ncbi:conserved unknown protein [Ectocarpus siliculosus]|uniref:Uncharacterized protein n=1 Tax=Ectocarpus siliculosus TaxID=2880 RepID=D8LAY3_ECTSI|nr:conserved unknown protein [Ectocarpus siliculosus]|eukprot:CBN76492.1 conserved unknown protein [Ectocarpus siliculosus]